MATSLERLQNRNYAFVTCGIKVNTRSSGWQRTVRSVLSKIRGVRDCRMDEYGVIQVSGIVSPELLIKKLSKAGTKAELLWLQYGQYSSNFYASMPLPNRSSYAGDHNFQGHDAYGYGPHGGAGGYYGPRHCYRPFAGLVHEIQQQQQRRGANLVPMHTVYIPRYHYGGDAPGCCNLM